MSKLNKKANYISQKLEKGEIYYLSGKSTKVKILDFVEYCFPLVEILEVKNSKFNVGEKVRISRQILYKRKGN